jgi:peptidoglycan/xylan/chitin deacetylase (PgdA/CDA1 family)
MSLSVRRICRKLVQPVMARPALFRFGRGRLIVLCYHDLCEKADFSSWLRVEVGAFRTHLEVLSKHGRFVGPDSLDHLDALAADRLHFLVTFDDGYLNNLRLAADVLEQYRVPALFFVSTHHLVTGEPFWFDRVVTRVQAAGLLTLDLESFGLGRYSFFDADGERRWNDIQVLLTDIKGLGNPNDPAVARILEHLDSTYGSASRKDDERFRPMSVTELKELARRDQIFVGSHGHVHEILTRLDDTALAENVSTSKQILETLLSTQIEHIAYPNGDEDTMVRDACRSAGYRRGYSTAPGTVPRSPDFLNVPRLLVGGYDSASDLVTNINTLLLQEASPRQ